VDKNAPTVSNAKSPFYPFEKRGLTIGLPRMIKQVNAVVSLCKRACPVLDTGERRGILYTKTPEPPDFSGGPEQSLN
jgi:hypothetical protein